VVNTFINHVNTVKDTDISTFILFFGQSFGCRPGRRTRGGVEAAACPPPSIARSQRAGAAIICGQKYTPYNTDHQLSKVLRQ
jgi:hypothetical protein